jgi:hypothetical protein
MIITAARHRDWAVKSVDLTPLVFLRPFPVCFVSYVVKTATGIRPNMPRCFTRLKPVEVFRPDSDYDFEVGVGGGPCKVNVTHQ